MTWLAQRVTASGDQLASFVYTQEVLLIAALSPQQAPPWKQREPDWQ